MNVFPLSPGCLVGFPGASLSVGSPWLARQSSVPRWFACKSHAVALSLLLFSLLLFLFLLLLFFFFVVVVILLLLVLLLAVLVISVV